MGQKGLDEKVISVAGEKMERLSDRQFGRAQPDIYYLVVSYTDIYYLVPGIMLYGTVRYVIVHSAA